KTYRNRHFLSKKMRGCGHVKPYGATAAASSEKIEMLRFGILGAGRIGNVHARAIAASGRARVAYIADAMADAAANLAGVVGAKTASVQEVIAATDVDAILIATPTDTHADLIEETSRAGKAILCEKPVSLSV